MRHHLLDEITQFNEGNHHHAYSVFGCHPEGDQYRFTVWAPNAKRVALIGDFSEWNPIWMQPVFESGAWTIVVDNVHHEQRYKYRIIDQNDNEHVKIDPFARRFEEPPQDASLVWYESDYSWNDREWIESRRNDRNLNTAMNIYEVHGLSWRKHYNHSNYSFNDLRESLIPYVVEMGYTHIEFMPLMEHPLEASWGYQITGYFALTARFGSLTGFKEFVDYAHQAGIGVILDWVPGHFCQNTDALAYFDGSATYEYQDAVRARNKRWGALNFDLGKTQVQSFLISSALYWIEEFHIDGLRVDAVSNMLYRDYDLPPHVLNDDGSNVNREGVAFIQRLNTVLHDKHKILTIAEESTAWDGVTRDVASGGLGFDYKWNMGWMNDTLKFFEMDPEYRKHHMNLITFIFMYQYQEHYILALSHDEVVHGKNSLLTKMPGDRYNQFAQLKVLYAYMMALPGKKLNFMGHELGQFLEWRYHEELEWTVLNYDYNREYRQYIADMNHLVQSEPALSRWDTQQEGLEIMRASHDEPLIMILLRWYESENIMFLLNFEPHEHTAYRVGVNEPGTYHIVINSEMKMYGGSWIWNDEYVTSEAIPCDNRTDSIEVVVPAYGVLVIKKT